MTATRKRGAIVLTGARSFLGRRILPDLGGLRGQQVVVLDSRRPEEMPPDARYYKIDLTQPTADAMIADILQREKVETVVHLAFRSNPARRGSESHELEVIGTLNMLNACAATSVRQVVLRSTTLAYGAHPLNPNYLTEDHPLQAPHSYRFAADKVEVEGLAARFRKRYDKITTTVLRFAPVLGPTVDNYVSRYLQMPVCMTLLGFDPLIQLLHEVDATEALKVAIQADRGGVFNVVSRGVVPLSSMLYLAGKVNWPVFHTVAYPMVNLGWQAGISPVPADHLDYARYLFVADGERAEKELGFQSALTTRETIEGFSGVERVRRLEQAA